MQQCEPQNCWPLRREKSSRSFAVQRDLRHPYPLCGQCRHCRQRVLNVLTMLPRTRLDAFSEIRSCGRARRHVCHRSPELLRHTERNEQKLEPGRPTCPGTITSARTSSSRPASPTSKCSAGARLTGRPSSATIAATSLLGSSLRLRRTEVPQTVSN